MCKCLGVQAREQQAELRQKDWRVLGQGAWMWFGVMGSHWSIKGRGVSGLSDFSAGCPGDSSHLWKNWEKGEPGEQSQALAIVTSLS